MITTKTRRIPGHWLSFRFAGSDHTKSFESARRRFIDAGIADDAIVCASDDMTTLAAQIDKCRGIWFCGGQQSRLAATLLNTPAEDAIYRLLQRDGMIGGTSAGAAIMSRTMIQSSNPVPVITSGLDLLPDGIVDQHFRQRNRQPRLKHAIKEHPNHFGIGIDEGTAVFVRGRLMEVVGSGVATIVLPGESKHFPSIYEVSSGQRADLTQIRRSVASRDTNLEQPDSAKPVRVESGSLVIVGGGRMTDDVVDRFIELAGSRLARIVVLPTASTRQQAFRAPVPSFLRDREIAEVTVLPHSLPDEVASHDFVSTLKRATGVWFGGGRQWRFLDAYENTEAVELFRDVLRRGGVIGGSSAGATIQGEYLVRGHPLGNTIMMAEGYEKGFAFLSGVAIDQHFSQRNRLPDLIPVIRARPEFLGIGIDESTALVVQSDKAEVIGEHSAFILHSDALSNDSSPANDGDDTSGEPDKTSPYVEFASGQTIDFAEFAMGEK